MFKRWLASAFIVAYLSALGCGIVSHAFKFRQNAHPMMYFVVWDMFSGWSAYASRTHVIAEGESGKYYRLTPTPWGEYHPYSNLGRQHYDPFSSHCQRIGTNVLRHTEHEPISRMYVVQEAWAKKYNVPDAVWYRLYEEPKEMHRYYHLRGIYTAQGAAIQLNDSWINYQRMVSVADTRHLQYATSKSRPMYDTTVGHRRSARPIVLESSEENPGSTSVVPVGN
jgi:hypothetical protein